ncbi:MAG: hypothetical protein WAM70_15160 [Pyrinomonadaceae bacterium]
MRIPTFTFKNEAIWMVVFPLAPAVIGFVLLVVFWLLRSAF